MYKYVYKYVLLSKYSHMRWEWLSIVDFVSRLCLNQSQSMECKNAVEKPYESLINTTKFFTLNKCQTYPNPSAYTQLLLEAF